ncbi:MAG: hypothetical protein M3373_05075 [Gemmatimonadota bacterium]|nr:hypothetical protein [Gemmatimonadota bacterium]
MSRSLHAAFVAGLLLAGRSTLGQDTTITPAVACAGERVTSIDVQPEPPRIIGRSAPAWRRALLRTVFQHATTRESVVRSYLLLDVGEPCTPERRSESERLLRSPPFIADATVRAFADTGGAVRIVAETVDEIPLVVNGRLRDGGISSFTYGNSNINGTGMYGSLRWTEGDAFRDGWAVRYAHYNVFDRPYRFNLHAERSPLGHDVSLALGHPFLTNLQRSAWHAGVTTRRAYTGFIRPDEYQLSLRHDRSLWNAGWVGRVGGARTGAFAGALATHERFTPAADAIVITDTGLAAPDDDELDGRYAAYRSYRLSGVLGLRLLDFFKAAGFDALVAEQDVARGIQVGGVLGRSLPWFEATDRDIHLSVDTYGGVGNARSFVGTRFEWEGRRDLRQGRWDAIVMSGRLAWYRKLAERRTLVSGVEFSGGWRERLPLQLSLGERRAGLRGYRGTTVAGGRRLVARVEQRHARGSLTRFARWGTAVFVDAGKTWSGGVPFGETTTLRASVGGSLLAAIPQQSRRMLRVDLAVPVTPDAPDRVSVRFSAENATRTFWREPGDVSRVRAGSPASGIFSWP